MDLSFNPADLITPAGLIVAGAIVRQATEIVKNLVSWVDAGRERVFATVLAVLLYGYWYFAFGTTVPNGAWLAVTAGLAVIATSIGINEVVDGTQATVARVVAKQTVEETGQPTDTDEGPEAPDLVDEEPDEPVAPVPPKP